MNGAPMAIADFRRERDEFPTLSERTYLAAQCFGPYPQEMLDDLRAYQATIERRNRAIGEWAERFSELHDLTERLLGAPGGSVFFRESATAAQAAIASAITAEKGRRRVLIASGDFHSSRFLWAAQAARGFKVVEVDSRAHDHSDPGSFTQLLDERVAVVALSLVSPRSGALLDARAITTAARAVGAISVIDAFQAMGVVPVEVDALGADVIVGGFHKWVGGGGMGLAFGYVAPSLSAKLEPAYPGWMGHADMLGFREHYEPAPGAARFQQGSPAVEPIYTSRAGIRWVLRVGASAIRARNLELTRRILERAEQKGIRSRTPRQDERRGGMVCLEVEDGTPIVESLADEGIDIDFRPGAGLRLGPHPCVTEHECDRVVDAIAARMR